MPATYDALASTVLGSATSPVIFDNINQTYTDLVLIMLFANNSGGQQAARLQFNDDSGNNYPQMRMLAFNNTPSNTITCDQTTATFIDIGYVQGVGGSNVGQGLIIVNIQNYTATNMFKGVVSRWGTPSASAASTSYITHQNSTWASTAAISKITMSIPTSFATGSAFSLYGIKKA